ncbi:MAG: asparagine synthetase A [Candidatus Aenigmatarchaeota archaeon]
MKAVLKVQEEVMKAIREFLYREGFLEILPPLLDSITDPGIRGAKFFEVEAYGKKYKLMSALTVHKPLLAKHFGKIFSFCPCFRKEPEECKKTKRHLAQFWQVEVEVLGKQEDAMRVLERLIQFVCKKVKKKCKKELKILGRKLRVPRIPFKRISYGEALEIARKMGLHVSSGKEIPWEVEKELSKKFIQPFFITHYPKGSRGFYEKIDGEKLLDFDLIYDSGFGEACSGSEREYEEKKIVEKIKGTEIAKCKWYLKSIKSLKPTSGFGIGLERLTRYVCGLKCVYEASLMPIIPGGEIRRPW